MGELPPPPTPPEAKPKKKKATLTLFGGAPKPAPAAPAVDLTKELTDMSRRIRILEERYDNLKRKIQLVEGNLLDTSKKVMIEVRTSASDILDMKADLKDMEAKINLLIKEITLSAKKEDVAVIKKYIEFWQPLNFVTPTQVEKIVREILEEKTQQNL